MRIEEEFYHFMVRQGVDATTARAAARACERRLLTNAALGFGVGATIDLVTANPGAVMMGLATGGAAATLTVMASPSCSAVREAASKLATLE